MLRQFIKNRKASTEFKKFRKLSGDYPRFPVDSKFVFLQEATSTTDFDRHYIYHPAWAARVLAMTKPDKHIDISSTLHFCSMLSAFVPVKFYDIRPAKLSLSGLTTGKADLLHLPFADDSIRSLSCMHTIEHIGLGRYDDLLDPDGDLKAISELKRVMAHGGNLLFVVPIGKQKIVFNAHRIYAYDQILSFFSGFSMQEFALIPDHEKDGGLVYGAPKQLTDAQSYGCGCFWFTKHQ